MTVLHRNIPDDGKVHAYCLDCRRESLERLVVKKRVIYRCSICSYVGPRVLIIDPAIEWETDRQNRYWHKTSGIFVRNGEGKFLFFKRTTYPYGLAVPAGHVDRGESYPAAAKRELREETGIDLPESALRFVALNDIYGDQCRRGADHHSRQIFACQLPRSAKLKVDPAEGDEPMWLTLPEAKHYGSPLLTFAVDKIIASHRRKIEAALS